MKLQTNPANRGSAWVRQGFRVFLKQPMAFAALFAAFLFGAFVLALIPYLGSLLVVATLPLTTLGFMIGTREVLDGRVVTPGAYLMPLRAPRPQVVALVQLGLAYALCTFLIVWLSDLADGGAFEALMEAIPAAQTAPDKLAEKMADPRLTLGLALRLGLAGLMSVPFWHAPALVYWERHSAAKALFASTVACWRNRAAFTVYSLAWFGVVAGLGLVGTFVFSLLGAQQVFAAAGVPLSLLISTVFYASLYFTYADCFVEGDHANTTAGSP